MRRLYLYLIQAAVRSDEIFDLETCLSWTFGSGGDDVSERAWAHARRRYPEDAGYLAHQVRIATLDDRTVAELVRIANEEAKAANNNNQGVEAPS